MREITPCLVTLLNQLDCDAHSLQTLAMKARSPLLMS